MTALLPDLFDARTPRSRDDEFAEFWRYFPRKTAKLDARKAFDQARRIVDFGTIMDGVRRFAAQPHDLRYTPYPASWLRAGQWDDEPAHVAPVPQSEADAFDQLARFYRAHER